MRGDQGQTVSSRTAIGTLVAVLLTGVIGGTLLYREVTAAEQRAERLARQVEELEAAFLRLNASAAMMEQASRKIGSRERGESDPYRGLEVALTKIRSGEPLARFAAESFAATYAISAGKELTAEERKALEDGTYMRKFGDPSAIIRLGPPFGPPPEPPP